MTGAQAAAELGRLCRELGKSQTALSADQTRAWLRVLEGLTYERGRAAVTHLVDSWTRTDMPPPGALRRAAEQASYEGQPNAGAYSQNASGPRWAQTERGAYALWVSQELSYMRLPLPIEDEPTEADLAALPVDERRALEGEVAEARYWRYVTDEAYKRACEQAWRRLWAERGAA